MKKFFDGTPIKLITDKTTAEDAIVCFIDNSIEAYLRKTTEINEHFKIDLELRDNKMLITDYSGGILTKEEEERLTSFTSGRGLKLGAYVLGENVIINSSNYYKNFKVILDKDFLSFKHNHCEIYENNVNESSIGIFSVDIDLNEETIKHFRKDENLDNLREEFASRYRIFREKGLSLKIKGKEIGKFEIGDLIKKIDLDDEGSYINIYRLLATKNNKQKNGIDLFINGFRKFDRERGTRSKFKKLSETGFTFKDIVIEINYNLKEDETDEDIIKEVGDRFLSKVREEMDLFAKDTVLISYDADIGEATELKKKFSERTFKSVGEKSFEFTYNFLIKSSKD